jgi:hypothetical protein
VEVEITSTIFYFRFQMDIKHYSIFNKDKAIMNSVDQHFFKSSKEKNMAFVVIQHLDLNHVGIMPELPQRTTS